MTNNEQPAKREESRSSVKGPVGVLLFIVALVWCCVPWPPQEWSLRYSIVVVVTLVLLIPVAADRRDDKQSDK